MLAHLLDHDETEQEHRRRGDLADARSARSRSALPFPSMNDDRRRTVANFLSYAGVGPMAIGLVLPMLRPHLLIAWVIAIGLAIAGALCMGVSQRMLDDD